MKRRKAVVKAIHFVNESLRDSFFFLNGVIKTLRFLELGFGTGIARASRIADT
jgi:hypothetical protein